ncbi:MAG: aminotransferase class V-fold PLP-dependent enzyme, partial [Deltaproteobacteria bacterium]|nr:aminotransferase class V-fold PLP-dependent enzyme [Deltaproteobacteria bacterium]
MAHPGAPMPSTSAAGASMTAPPVPEAVPAAMMPGTMVPMAHPGAPMPSTSAAGASMTAPPVPEAIPAAMVPGTTIPISRPETPMPSASAPGALITAPPAPEAAAAAMLPGTTVPVSWPGTDSIPLLPSGATAAGPLPDATPLPRIIEGMDGGLPRILDGSVATHQAPATTTLGYYFLAPAPASASSSAPAFRRRTFEVQHIRRDFPILSERVHGKRLIWLDNAATTHKPRAVIERLVRYYEHEYSNVHRGAHELAARSTNAYEDAREKIQHFLGASSASEIVFVRGTTEAVNLVAGSWGRRFVEKGDEILLTTIEHHSNIVPWQLLAETVGARIRVVPVTDRGEVLLDDYAKLLNSHTRLVALTHVSNALGT